MFSLIFSILFFSSVCTETDSRSHFGQHKHIAVFSKRNYLKHKSNNDKGENLVHAKHEYVKQNFQNSLKQKQLKWSVTDTLRQQEINWINKMKKDMKKSPENVYNGENIQNSRAKEILNNDIPEIDDTKIIPDDFVDNRIHAIGPEDMKRDGIILRKQNPNPQNTIHTEHPELNKSENIGDTNDKLSNDKTAEKVSSSCDSACNDLSGFWVTEPGSELLIVDDQELDIRGLSRLSPAHPWHTWRGERRPNTHMFATQRFLRDNTAINSVIGICKIQDKHMTLELVGTVFIAGKNCENGFVKYKMVYSKHGSASKAKSIYNDFLTKEEKDNLNKFDEDVDLGHLESGYSEGHLESGYSEMSPTETFSGELGSGENFTSAASGDLESESNSGPPSSGDEMS